MRLLTCTKMKERKITLCYAVFVYLSLYTHLYPRKGERRLALGPSVKPKIKHVTNYRQLKIKKAKEIYSVLLDKAKKIYNKIYNDEMNFKERL